MLINPSLLFLDEPTSGLDSTTAQKIVSTLEELANGGRTIVMTIHQPSSRLFYMFHKILLLYDGNPMYFGMGSVVLDYFSSIGFVPSVAMNPSDFLLDLANGISTDDSQEDQATVKQTLVHAYQDNLLESVKSQAISDNNPIQNSTLDKKVKGSSNTWWQEITVLFGRGLKERRYKAFAWLIKISQVSFIAVISGLLWWQSDISNLQDQVGLLFFEGAFWGNYPMFQVLYTFPQERLMLTKERSPGMYRLSSFFMAMTLGYLPMELVLPTVFHTIVYWMAGLKPEIGPFIYNLLVILYIVLGAQGLGLAIGALVMDMKSATSLGSGVILTFTLAGGYHVQSVPNFIAWIQYISINQYTFELLLTTQYEPGETCPCGTNTCLVEDFPMIRNMRLRHTIVSVIALGIMIVGYRLIAYFSLMRLGVPKK